MTELHWEQTEIHKELAKGFDWETIFFPLDHW